MKFFISCTQSDGDLARRLSLDLARLGFEPLTDRQLLSPGSSISEWFSRAISESDAVIVLVSKEYDGSSYAEAELSMAVYQQSKGKIKGIIPVLTARDVVIPPLLQGLASIRASDLSYHSLVDTLGNALCKLADPTSVGGSNDLEFLGERAAALRYERKIFFSSRFAKDKTLAVTIIAGALIAVLLGICFTWVVPEAHPHWFEVISIFLAFALGRWGTARYQTTFDKQNQVDPFGREDD
jgi:hypothetical protein